MVTERLVVEETYPELREDPRLAVHEELVLRAQGIFCTLVVPPKPSYLPTTIRHFYSPRPVLSDEASKDARVGAHFSPLLIQERTAQQKAKKGY